MWSTVDGKNHDGNSRTKKPNVALQMAREKARKEKEERKRKRAEQLAEARAARNKKKKLAEAEAEEVDDKDVPLKLNPADNPEEDSKEDAMAEESTAKQDTVVEGANKLNPTDDGGALLKTLATKIQATKIQRVWRWHRNELAKKNAEEEAATLATKIQRVWRWYRNELAKKHAEEEAATSATKIQRVWRWHRNELAKKNAEEEAATLATKIQRVWRWRRNELAKEKAAAEEVTNKDDKIDAKESEENDKPDRVTNEDDKIDDAIESKKDAKQKEETEKETGVDTPTTPSTTKPPSPKPKATLRHKPRKFKPMSERTYAKGNNQEDDNESEEEEDSGFGKTDDDSVYIPPEKEEKDDDEEEEEEQKEEKDDGDEEEEKKEEETPSTPKKEAAKPTQPAASLPPPKDNKQHMKKHVRNQFDSNSEFLGAIFPPGESRKRKIEDSSNPRKGQRATEKKRDIGQHPASEKQQMDDKARKQFKLSLKHDSKLMPMMTPISRMDDFFENAAGRSDLTQIAQEVNWNHIIPIKGLYNTMQPNEGGNKPIRTLLKPKLGLLVPSKKVGAEIFDIMKKAVLGEVQLQFFYEAFGEEGLVSMIEAQAPSEPAQKVEKQETAVKAGPTDNGNGTIKKNGEEYAEM